MLFRVTLRVIFRELSGVIVFREPFGVIVFRVIIFGVKMFRVTSKPAQYPAH